ncbi:MAG: type II and III secretion system protein family protein [Pseudomonadales bacterium]
MKNNMLRLIVLCASLWTALAQGQSYLQVKLGQGELVRLPRAAQAVFVADPSIANYQAPSARTLFVFGNKPGTTSLYALDESDQVIYRARVTVQQDLAALRALIAKQYPKLSIDVSAVSGRIFLRGQVPDVATASALMKSARAFAQPSIASGGTSTASNGSTTTTVTSVSSDELVINQLTITNPNQVNIRVKVAEVSRTVSNRLGFRWGEMVNGSLVTGSTGLGFDIDWSDSNIRDIFSVNGGTLTGMLDALASEGLVNVLAEPNLTALSGESASFLAGGEIFIPVPDGDGGISLQPENFGVKLDVTPTVLSADRISLKIKPEVSSLTNETSIELNGTRVPGKSVRTAETTIELASGQSFALAGLLQSNETTNVSQMPFLGDVPILGALFRSTQFERNETELVIIATVYNVEPTSARQYQLPQDGMQPYSDLERMLNGRILKPSPPVGGALLDVEQPRLLGENGFYY